MVGAICVLGDLQASDLDLQGTILSSSERLPRKSPLRVIKEVEAVKLERRALRRANSAAGAHLTRLNLAIWIWALTKLREPAAPPPRPVKVLCGAERQGTGPKGRTEKRGHLGRSGDP